MWHKPLFTILLGLLAATAPAGAAQVTKLDCRQSGAFGECRIQLEGVVQAEDHLLISRVNDRDWLYFDRQEIASTADILGRPVFAPFLPRYYALGSLRGVRNPVLILRTQSGLGHSTGIPATAKVQVVGGDYPRRKLVAPLFFSLLSWGVLAVIALYLASRRGSQKDGWLFPERESRWLLLALSLRLLLAEDLSSALAPAILSERTHLFLQNVFSALAFWATCQVLLLGRFSDRSCIEPPRKRARPQGMARASNLALVLALGGFAAFPQWSARGQAIALAPLLLCLLASCSITVLESEWRRILKRSAPPPVRVHLSLLGFALAGIGTELPLFFGFTSSPLYFHAAGWTLLVFAASRFHNLESIEAKGRSLAAECRRQLLECQGGSLRLDVLCTFIEEEWRAARVSLISVSGDTGLVLASSGPDAIPPAHRIQPRRLGPFLRRVCKRGQLLYAPVVEELGQDLREQGLRHSSLGIPIVSAGKVRGVLCVMADEDERIPPTEALQLEMLMDSLQIETLSSMELDESERRNLQLMTIARLANGLAVEHLDRWGNLQNSGRDGKRLLLGADFLSTGNSEEGLRNTALGKLAAMRQQEIRSLWQALAEAYEFIIREGRDDFWAISPAAFRNPALQALGPDRVALLLGFALERHARAISSKPEFLVLGHQSTRIVVGASGLHYHASQGAATVELNPQDFANLVTLRQEAAPGAFLYSGDGSKLREPADLFSCRSKALAETEERIHSILAVSADKKELRRLDQQAFERIRASLRKAA
jgi:GAF domain-containing protein